MTVAAEHAGWSPACWLGGSAPGGLASPAASPTAGHLYAPRGVWLDDKRLVVCDWGNRRILFWRDVPAESHTPADIVLGQPDVASADENRGGPPDPASFRWPHAITGDERMLFVADAGNHRVLGWQGRPTSDRPADVVLGQPDFLTATELPHRPQGPARLRFPYGISLAGDVLAVADTANNRLLFWRLSAGEPAGSAAAAVVGQENFDASGENHWKAVAADTLCWPYGVSACGDRLAVADSGNNRVMLWQRGGG